MFSRKPFRRSGPDYAVLEDRIMLSATPLLLPGADAMAAEGETQTTATVAIEAPPTLLENDPANTQQDQRRQQQARVELVFVDAAVTDYQSFLEALQAEEDPLRELEIYLLDAGRDGVQQISEILGGYMDVDTVHLIAHGEEGRLKLGNQWLDQQSLGGYAGQLAAWSSAMTADADVMIYGCNLAESASGKELVDALAAITGADVAASTDAKGHASLGGDWDLEYQRGTIASTIAVDEQQQTNWHSLLTVGQGGFAIWTDAESMQPVLTNWDGTGFGLSTSIAGGLGITVTDAAISSTRLEAIALAQDESGYLSMYMSSGLNWAAVDLSQFQAVNLQNSQDQWINALSVASVAYESQSGDALLVWSVGDQVRYSQWNGTTWSTTQNLALYDGTVPLGIELVANPLTNEMIMVVTDINLEHHAVVWDGASFTNAIKLNADSAESAGEISVAYEAVSGHALVVYSEGDSRIHYRTWTGSWSDDQKYNPLNLGGGAVSWTSLAADPRSNRILMGVTTTVGDSFVGLWDGSGWKNNAKLDLGTTTEAVSFSNASVSFESQSGEGMVVYAKDGNSVLYRTLSVSDQWSGEQVGPTLAASPHALSLVADPTSDQIMLAVQDQQQGLHYVAWDGQANQWTLQQTLGTAKQLFSGEPFLFLYQPSESTWEPRLVTDEDTSLVFSVAAGNAIALPDHYDATSLLRVRLSASHGTLAVPGVGGPVDQDEIVGATNLVLEGTRSQIEGILDGLVFLPAANYSGQATIQVSVEYDTTALAEYNFNDPASPGEDSGSTGAFTGVLRGDATVQSDAQRGGNVLVLDGSGDSLKIDTFVGEHQRMTLAAWVRLDSSSGSQELISIGDNIGIRFDGGQIQGFYHNTLLLWNQTRAAVNLAGDGWHHVAFTFDDVANQQVLYVDGVAVATTNHTASISWAWGDTTYVGRHGTLAMNHLEGAVDQVQIFGRVLGSDELNQLAGNVQPTAFQYEITVQPVNDAPTMTIFSEPIGQVEHLTTVEITLEELLKLGNEEDVDGQVVALRVSQIASGSLRIGTSLETATEWVRDQNDLLTNDLRLYWTAPTANTLVHAFSVQAIDDQGAVSTISAAATFNVVRTQSTPVMNAVDLFVDEHAAIGTTVGQFTLQTQQTGVAWELLESSTQAFSLDANTGVLSVARPELLDFEVAAVQTVQVRVSNSDGASDTRTFQVRINNIDDHEFKFISPETVEVLENERLVQVPSAQDADTPDGRIQYSIVEGLDSQFFAISEQGVLGFREPPDFENTRDENGDNTYVVELMATDANQQTTTQRVTIVVKNVNEAPQWTNTNLLTIAENLTDVATLDATDVDSAVDGLQFEIVGGADQALFEIGKDHVLRFKTAPDFEKPASAAGTNLYQVTIRVLDDQGAESIKTFAVQVTGINDSAPEFLTDEKIAVKENRSWIKTLEASDEDSAQTTLTYEIVGGKDQDCFSLSKDGLSFNKSANYEQPTDADGDGVYEVVVRVSDGTFSTEKQFYVHVTDANESLKANDDTYSIMGDQILKVEAGSLFKNDVDEDGDSLTASVNRQPNNGKVRMLDDGSFEYKPNAGFVGTDSFRYAVSDGRGATSVATVTINIRAVSSGGTTTTPSSGSSTSTGTGNANSSSTSNSSGTSTTASSSGTGSASSSGGTVTAPATMSVTSAPVTAAATASAPVTTSPTSATPTSSTVSNPNNAPVNSNAPVNTSPTAQPGNMNLATDAMSTPDSMNPTTPAMQFNAPSNNAAPTPNVPADVNVAAGTVKASVAGATPVAGNVSNASATATSNAGPAARVASLETGSSVSSSRASPFSLDRLQGQGTVRSPFVSQPAMSQGYGRGNELIFSFDTQTLAPVTLDYAANPLWRDLGEMREEIDSQAVTPILAAGTAVSASSAFTVGYVLWTVRSGLLATSLLAHAPVWRMVDPLSVLEGLGDDGGTDDSVESMFDRKS